MKKQLLFIFIAIHCVHGISAMMFDEDGTPVFKPEVSQEWIQKIPAEIDKNGKQTYTYRRNFIKKDYRFPGNLIKEEDAVLSYFFTATDRNNSGSLEALLQIDLADNYTEINMEFRDELSAMDGKLWRPWQKDENGKWYTFLVQCVDPKVQKANFCNHKVRLDIGSPHYKKMSEHEQGNIRMWNAYENEQFHDELQFLQTQQLVMERNLKEFNKNYTWFGKIWHRRAYQRYQKQYRHLKDEIELFKKAENRDAFSRTHIPRQYFESVKEARERTLKE